MLHSLSGRSGFETRNTSNANEWRLRGHIHLPSSGQKVPRELRRSLHTKRKKLSVGNEVRIRSVFPCVAKSVTSLHRRRLTLPCSYASKSPGYELGHNIAHMHDAIRCTFAPPLSIRQVVFGRSYRSITAKEHCTPHARDTSHYKADISNTRAARSGLYTFIKSRIKQTL